MDILLCIFSLFAFSKYWDNAVNLLILAAKKPETNIYATGKSLLISYAIKRSLVLSKKSQKLHITYSLCWYLAKFLIDWLEPQALWIV